MPGSYRMEKRNEIKKINNSDCETLNVLTKDFTFIRINEKKKLGSACLLVLQT
jgi:hypothetical protein